MHVSVCHTRMKIHNVAISKSNQKYPSCKKEWPRPTTGLAEKDVKSNGRPMPPDFDSFERFGHDELTAKHCYFRCSRPPDVDQIKNMTRLQNIKIKEVFLWPGHLYQKV